MDITALFQTFSFSKMKSSFQTENVKWSGQPDYNMQSTAVLGILNHHRPEVKGSKSKQAEEDT